MTVASQRGRLAKVHLSGTHRVCPPEQTWRRVRQTFSRVGVTRVADVTGLDDIGIPVFQAVRPDAYSVSVSQGKGLTPVLAKVSAAMESVELWHAEHLTSDIGEVMVGDVANALGYRLDELAVAPRSFLNPGLRLAWSTARRLTDGGSSLVPTALIHVDRRAGAAWAPRLFVTTSNGLASGNTVEEATLHGLCEVVERDAWARAKAAPLVGLDLSSVDGPAGVLLELFRSAQVEVHVRVLPSPVGLPCFRALITSETFPVAHFGMGAHTDRDVSLCRALTEAAQSRLTSIAGSRDDIAGKEYEQVESIIRGRARRPDLSRLRESAGVVSFAELASVANPDLGEDLRIVVERVREHTGRDPLVVDHTREDLGIPVVHVICPGLRHEHHAT
ncbi:MAG: YcaO-like family protein [Micromonosporaceae bacterium]